MNTIRAHEHDDKAFLHTDRVYARGCTVHRNVLAHGARRSPPWTLSRVARGNAVAAA
jgi:hypothetical protein